MNYNIFYSQCEFIEYWDNNFKNNFEGKSVDERIKFFRKLNEELANFYYRYIDYNIWQVQRAYFFSFWIGILYIKNSDCLSQIEQIVNFSKIYGSLGKIVAMLNTKVHRVIIDAEHYESMIIFEKMNEFKKEYSHFESKVNKIIEFFRIIKRKNLLKKHCTSISILRKNLPDEIVLHILNNFLKCDNDYKIKYLQNKLDIDKIMHDCGLNKDFLTFVIDIYFRNKQNIDNSITEILSRDYIFL